MIKTGSMHEFHGGNEDDHADPNMAIKDGTAGKNSSCKKPKRRNAHEKTKEVATNSRLVKPRGIVA